MVAIKQRYYSDEKTDDFAGNSIRTRVIDGSFPFIHTSFLWKIASAFMYYVIALPLVFLINKFYFGVRIKNRRALKPLKDGCFLYGNHTQAFTDATCPTLIAFPKRAYVIAGADAASIRGIAWLVQMLGGLILPNKAGGMKAFVQAVQQRCREKSVIMVYPEAHIWPYYTGIRPFPSTSFAYAVKNDKPVVACVTTYRKRLLPFLPPAVTITLSDPFYRSRSLSEHEARQELRDKVYDFMCGQAENNEVEYIRYIKM